MGVIKADSRSLDNGLCILCCQYALNPKIDLGGNF